MSRTLHFGSHEAAKLLHDGAVGVIPTDTLYGVVASAWQPQAVARVYELKGRSLHKPCIILVDDTARIAEFGVPQAEIARVSRYWPGPLSVIFSTMDQKFAYLQRDLGMPPFRVPGNAALREFLRYSGPLIAPSANLQGEAPAETVAEARAVFGEAVDLYIDGGHLHGEPSTIVKVDPAGHLEMVRQGVLKLTQ